MGKCTYILRYVCTYFTTRGNEGSTHQQLRTIELHLSDNAVGLEIRDPEAGALVSSVIDLRSRVGAYNECERRPSNTIPSSVPTGGSFDIALLTIIRFSGALAIWA